MILPSEAQLCDLDLHEVHVKTTEMSLLAEFSLYQKMLEKRPHLKLKNNATSFSDIFQSERAARIMLGPIVMLRKKAASFKLIPANVISKPTTYDGS